MLKTSFGKAIVGVVALSGVATHAADWLRGGVFDLQGSGKTQLQNEGWGKLPIEWGDYAVNAQLGAAFAPIYGFNTSVQFMYAPFWTPYQTQIADKYAPTHHFGGLIGKVHYAVAESWSIFGQLGIGGTKAPELSDTFLTTVWGGGINLHIDGGLHWTVIEYKNFNGWGERPFNYFGSGDSFGTISTGVKYNFS